ncbi:hypothetical protein P691DRAFT_790221 [Macrolepiota fuliginosa MF-IS2]|uniref:Uncharacterized protein n=1 Tax=Macrolepiota fuliginosa MF-IS2 TaxID=1400762 RepID=A0A9P5XEE8_9AGAR|nr:hypothetical protein P691DRAFT_790221 [Macrolepiota fuliginosa MF-IS2]
MYSSGCFTLTSWLSLNFVTCQQDNAAVKTTVKRQNSSRYPTVRQCGKGDYDDIFPTGFVEEQTEYLRYMFLFLPNAGDHIDQDDEAKCFQVLPTPLYSKLTAVAQHSEEAPSYMRYPLLCGVGVAMILDPGRVPEIKPVTRFPGRVKVGGDAKVPTVIYYGSDGVPQAIGAETEREGIETLAHESQWEKAEWFKLHLRPKTRTSASVTEDIPPLPRGKTAVDVFADFLNYMNQCARSYIAETHVDGAGLLASGRVEFILTHPNSWEGAQQALMRRAAVQAGLIVDTATDQARISFVTEGEASLNFCIDKGLMNESIKRGDGVTIVDAGGGTLDINTFARKGTSNDEYEEIAAAQSYFKGAIFVTRAARKYLDEFLVGSRFYDDTSSMADKFDKTTKLAFRDPNDPQYIKFGNARDRDPNLGIRAGQLKLDGNIIAGFFEPSIQCIMDAVDEQRRLATQQILTVFLVGGFAASDYLFAQLQERLQSRGLDVRRPDAHMNKAVPDGAIAGFLSPTVRTRVARFTFGVQCNLHYNPFKGDHAKRSASCLVLPSGDVVLPGGFESVLSKNTQVSESQEFRSSFTRVASAKTALRTDGKTPITCHRGNGPCPEFVNQDASNFYDVFDVHADLSEIIKKLEPQAGVGGRHYFTLDFDVIILFGVTEFKAQWCRKAVLSANSSLPLMLEQHTVVYPMCRAKVGGDAKVPTVIYYGPDGVPQAIGAETEREGIEALADEFQWEKTEWFKLHLRPKTRTSASVTEDILPLPRGKTIVDVFADFLRYMYQCARSYIAETHIDGSSLLASGRVEFILSHPNSWEGAQQSLMRNAAVQAGLIVDTPKDQARISFVTEGEASLNFCIGKGLMNESIRQGEGVIIVDAGEIFLDSRFYEDVPFMADKFDKTTKLAFRDPNDPQYIKFGNVRDKDPNLGIRAGQLRLDGNIIARFFEPSIQTIVDAVEEQKRLASREIRTVFLVGGFAASDYLFSQLQERLQSRKLDVRRPDAHLNKAVPDGAIAGLLKPTVHTRVARYTFGIRCNTLYDPSKEEHIKRSADRITLPGGEIKISGGFWSILSKNTQVSESQEFRSHFFREAPDKSSLGKGSRVRITCHRGSGPCPEFVDQDASNFYDVFKIRADLSGVIKNLKPQTGAKGKQYFRLDFDIIVLFGVTEFKAQYAWKENGVEKRTVLATIDVTQNTLKVSCLCATAQLSESISSARLDWLSWNWMLQRRTY